MFALLIKIRLVATKTKLFFEIKKAALKNDTFMTSLTEATGFTTLCSDVRTSADTFRQKIADYIIHASCNKSLLLKNAFFYDKFLLYST